MEGSHDVSGSDQDIDLQALSEELAKQGAMISELKATVAAAIADLGSPEQYDDLSLEELEEELRKLEGRNRKTLGSE